MIDIDRMVGWLMKLMQDSHLSSCLCSCRENSIAEVVFRNYLRAAESKEDASVLDALNASSQKAS